MNCPHFALPIAPPQAHCGSCGFHDAALASYLGADWVRLERITDTADCLRLEESRDLEVRLDDFERQFPQGFAAFYFGALPPKLNPLELGMWLLNHGAFSTQQFTKRNEFGFVCVVDPLAGRHGIAVGYALEKILSATLFQQLLGSMTPLLRAGRWAGGFFHRVRPAFRNSSREGSLLLSSVGRASATRAVRQSCGLRI